MKTKKGSIVKEAKNSEVEKLKKRVRRLEKDKKYLISKLNTAEEALKQNLKFLKGTTEDVSVEDLIEAAKNNKTLEEVKDSNICPKCNKEELITMKTLFGELSTCICGYAEKREKNEINKN